MRLPLFEPNGDLVEEKSYKLEVSDKNICDGKEVLAIILIFIIITIILIFIIITRPKPPFGRQGLAGSWGKDKVRRVNFGVFSTSHIFVLVQFAMH